MVAEVRDALWMLTRQWQMGEFEGDDAGSPIEAVENACASGGQAVLSVVHKMLAGLAVLNELGLTADAALGHSLGEYSALCSAGVMKFPELDLSKGIKLPGSAGIPAGGLQFCPKRPAGMPALVRL